MRREVLGRPGGPQQNIDEMLETFRQGEARRRPEDHPLLPPPRFDVGSRVMCCVEEEEEIWLTGTVVRHWAQQEGLVCPYVVQVDEDGVRRRAEGGRVAPRVHVRLEGVARIARRAREIRG